MYYLHLVKLILDERKTLTKVSTRTTSHNHSPKQVQASDTKEQENQQTRQKASCIARGENQFPVACKTSFSCLHNWWRIRSIRISSGNNGRIKKRQDRFCTKLWDRPQLLQTIHDDAVRFGVNSPEPTTSKQSAPAVRPFSPTGHAEPAQRERQPSPCKPTIVRYEPPNFNLQVPKQMYTITVRNQVLQNHVVAAEAMFSKVAVLEDLIQQEPHNAAHYKEVQRIQRNQHIQVAIKLQHMLEADDKLRKAAGLPQLDLPEHLWRVRNMDTANIREQHFMAISSEAEVLCQQLKGKGMYPVPPTYTQITKPNVHFQPIQPAKLTPLQPQDRLLFDPLLHTTGGSTGSQSHRSNGSMQSYDTTPPKVLTPSPCMPEPTIPPTPYVNQVVVEQHTRAQSPPVPPRNTATVATSPQESQGTSVAQEPLITLAELQQAPPQVQEQMTRPSHEPRKSKSKDGQGVKQSRNNKTTDSMLEMR